MRARTAGPSESYKTRRATSSPARRVDAWFDGQLEKPLLQMAVQERLDWIDEIMRLRSEWKPVPRSDESA